MADVHDKETRSYNMSRIRSKDTKPEMIVRKFLFANGFRYRIHVKSLPRKPDIVLSKYRVIVFVNGCFWHGHKECNKAPVPKTNTKWWVEKIEANVSKDKEGIKQLKKDGWRVIIIWQCELQSSAWGQKLIKFIAKKNQGV